MKEIWKTIEGYTDYQISNYGKIKSFKYNKEKILKHSLDSDEYSLIILCSNKNKFTKTIHRLVANAFINNPDNKPQVNHKDGNKQNNNVDNLEWVTISENIIHAYKNNLKTQQGISNTNCKLSENEVLTIHGLYLSGMTQSIISELYNIPQQHVSLIVNNKSWTHLTGV